MLGKRSEYWQLVEALMVFGWYREQPPRTKEPKDSTWSFRNGHTIEDGVAQRRQIEAPSEVDAMRLLLADLRRHKARPRTSLTGDRSAPKPVADGSA